MTRGRSTVLVRVFSIALAVQALGYVQLHSCEWFFVYEVVPRRFTAVFYRGDAPMQRSLVVVYREKQPNSGGKQALRSDLTDNDGRVEFTDLDPGFYEINVKDGDAEVIGLHVEVRAKAEPLKPALEKRLPPPPRPIYPPTMRSLAGVVFDETGAVVPDAKITIESSKSSSPMRQQLLTDANGWFSASVPDGEYLLTLFRFGFSQAKVPIKVAKSQPSGWLAAAITLRVASCELDPDPNPVAIKELETR